MRDKPNKKTSAAIRHADRTLQDRTTAMDVDESMLDPLLLDADEDLDLETLQGALQSYKAETLQWAEQRSAAMAVPHLGSWARSPRWALASMLLVACGVGMVLAVHPADETAAVAVAAPTAQALAEDERLLQSVDAALIGSGAAPTAEELGLTQTRAGTSTDGRVAQWMN